MFDALVIVDPLRVHLVLNMDSSSASSLQLLYCPHYVGGIAVARSTIYHQRNIYRRRDPPGSFRNIGQCKHGLGNAVARAQRVSAQIQGFKADFFGNLGSQRIVCDGGMDDSRTL